MKDTLVDDGKSPLQNVYDEELRARVETELKALTEPYRTTVILRDIEELVVRADRGSDADLAGNGEVETGAGARGIAKASGAALAGVRNEPSGDRARPGAAKTWTLGGQKLRSYHDVLSCEGAHVVLPGRRRDAQAVGADE